MGRVMGKSLKEERLGATNYNTQGYLMTVVAYNNADDVTIEFQDEYKTKIKVKWCWFLKGYVKYPYCFDNRLGATNYNKQGCLMKVVKYEGSEKTTVEFQDQYKHRITTQWINFQTGSLTNPYHPSVCGVGIVGNKCTMKVNGVASKEYQVWHDMIHRCFGDKNKKRYSAYKTATCCKEWLLFENFVKWLRSQENFKAWKNGNRYCLDKDILIKGNQVYGPDTCCLVPDYVNILFVTARGNRGNLPIGVEYNKKCPNNPYRAIIYKNGKISRSVYYKTPEQAFRVYKESKEAQIQRVAQEEYNKGTISKKCYEAMMRWEVEIGD